MDGKICIMVVQLSKRRGHRIGRIYLHIEVLLVPLRSECLSSNLNMARKLDK